MLYFFLSKMSINERIQMICDFIGYKNIEIQSIDSKLNSQIIRYSSKCVISVKRCRIFNCRLHPK